ncbi:hypothetical protein C1637_24180 [Chryseobacterium lactis]|uniref:Uncharacterized protein n=1 Tax=Chryseobacterium lactis TaxID=1241981 RepID=A0A3G6REY7_CHRLC|nr:hypothetical protein EG342_15685 [Chryseobacterium lactis]AZB03611.1 hypothetical protein EG341_06555 [Chryseobacterium lactis]PNW11178.1 hypothetical protein C1637_24180 [Chryseobacterium lactis]
MSFNFKNIAPPDEPGQYIIIKKLVGYALDDLLLIVIHNCIFKIYVFFLNEFSKGSLIIF